MCSVFSAADAASVAAAADVCETERIEASHESYVSSFRKTVLSLPFLIT